MKQFDKWMKTVDDEPISGASKAWIYEFMILAYLRWPFLVYNFSVNSVLPMEKTATRYLKSWYGAHKSFNPSVLYLPRSDHGLGITSISTCLKSMQITARSLAKHSTDIVTSGVYTLVQNAEAKSQSNQWRPTQELESIERQLQFKADFGGQSSRLGLGYNTKATYKSGSRKQRRKLATAHLKRKEAERLKLELLKLSRNCDFVKWDKIQATNRDWSGQIFLMPPETLSFILNQQAGTLPSPSNLRRWGADCAAWNCPLCGKFGATAKHILSNCYAALIQGRYTWRHDEVLATLAKHLLGLVKTANRATPRSRPIPAITKSFVRAGARSEPQRSKYKPRTLLEQANDWIVLIDGIPKRIAFPRCTGVDSNLRPDIMIYSKSRKVMIWAELTVPLEENVVDAEIRKTKRYLKLAETLRAKEWTVHPFTIEVGSLGWIADSTSKFLRSVGFNRRQSLWIKKQLSLSASRSSFLIWCSRFDKKWEKAERTLSATPALSESQREALQLLGSIVPT